MQFEHIPVLLNECIRSLNIKSGGIYLDGTLGGGGHALAIYKELDKDGILIGIDQDKNAIVHCMKRFEEFDTAKKIFVNSNFRKMKEVCFANQIEKVDGIILDLGVSSYQLDNGDRGFSYKFNARLDMRMDESQSLDAETIINNYSEHDLKVIIRDFGEERWAARIAAFIVKRRQEKRIQTTFELVDIIKAAIPKKARVDGHHPAKRTFQAIRIAVNKELEVIKEVIKDAVSMLRTGGRLCIITFHSLEDRIVKQEFAEVSKGCICPSSFPICVCKAEAVAKIINRKPIIPTKDEVLHNNRSRSAKLRVLEKII